jgi:hypothetical protein
MAAQDQTIDNSSLQNSNAQLAQAGENAVSFQNSAQNHVTINQITWVLFG